MRYSRDNLIFVIHFKVRMKVTDSCCVKLSIKVCRIRA